MRRNWENSRNERRGAGEDAGNKKLQVIGIQGIW